MIEKTQLHTKMILVYIYKIVQSSKSREKDQENEDSLANELMNPMFYKEMFDKVNLEEIAIDKLRDCSNYSLAKIFEKIYENVKLI